MKSMAAFVLLSVLSIAGAAFGDDEVRSVTVAGFVNLGGPGDASINGVMTKSLITFLARFTPKIIPFTDVEKAAVQDGFWKSPNLEPERAIGLAQAFDTERVITGDYLIDQKKNTVRIRVYVYDVVTAKLKLEREYNGGAGIDLFDTIDRMIRDVSHLLLQRTIEMGNLTLKMPGENLVFQVCINGNPVKELNSGQDFTEEFLAGMPLTLSLRLRDSGAEVFRTNVTVAKGEALNISAAVNTVAIVSGPETNRTVSGPGLRPPFYLLIRAAYLGGTHFSLGGEYRPLPGLRLSLDAGGVPWFDTNGGSGFLPSAGISASWAFLSPLPMAELAAGAFCELFFGNALLVTPGAYLEADWDFLFAQAGARFSAQVPSQPAYFFCAAGARF